MTKKITVSVTGMHCASCAKIIENELKDDPRFKVLQINPVTEQAEIEIIDADWRPEEINRQLKKMGYAFKFPDDSKTNIGSTGLEDQLQNLKHDRLAELSGQKKKLQIAVPLMAAILVAVFWSIAAKFFDWQPAELIPNNIFLPLVFAASTFILFWLGRDFLLAVGRFLRYGQANMDALIGLGTGTAYFYSALIYLFPAIRSALSLNEAYFFDVTIVVIILVDLGKYLENKAKLRTNETIEKLINLQTKTALVEKDGREVETSINDLHLGDIVIVKPGMKIPADGQVISGDSAVDEALITGESLPVDKKAGDEVIGSTINKSGVLKIQINKIGSDTVLSTIIKAIEGAQNSKAPIQKLADTVSGVFVPIVLALAGLTLFSWLIIAPHFMLWSQAVSLGITCFVSILAIACPCALGLATPTGIMVGLGLASKNGLLIKNASSLEKLGQIKIMAMDKTGTITRGQPTVSDLIISDGRREEIISIAASLENNSEHPLAQAIINLATKEKVDRQAVEHFTAEPGRGVRGTIAGQEYFLGNQKMLDDQKTTLEDRKFADKMSALEKQGKTIMILGSNQQIIALFAVADEIKPEAKEAIRKINQMGIRTVMLSGDRQAAADYIAQQAGISEAIAEVSPLQKADKIRELKNRGLGVAMIGDGINDAVALVAADIGIAMATGSDIAIESADITVLHGDLLKIVKALKISRLTIKKIKQNLFWAFGYNIISIPIAAGVLYPVYGILFSPIIAAGAMSFSSVSVLLNTLLMRRTKI